MKRILNYKEFINEGIKQNTFVSINESISKLEKSTVLKNTQDRLYNFLDKLYYGQNLEYRNNPNPSITDIKTQIWDKNLSQIVSKSEDREGILWKMDTSIDVLLKDVNDLDSTKSPVVLNLLSKYNDLKDISKFENDPDWKTLTDNEKDYIKTLVNNFNFKSFSAKLKDLIYSNSQLNYKSYLGFFGGREMVIKNLPGYSYSKITDLNNLGDFFLNKICNYTFFFLLNAFKEKVAELIKISPNTQTSQSQVSTKTSATIKTKKKVNSRPQETTQTTFNPENLKNFGY